MVIQLRAIEHIDMFLKAGTLKMHREHRITIRID